MAKVAKLILSFPHEFPPISNPVKKYKVVRSQHTTEFNPGDYLTKAEVDELNSSKAWDVSTTAAER